MCNSETTNFFIIIITMVQGNHGLRDDFVIPYYFVIFGLLELEDFHIRESHICTVCGLAPGAT